MWIYRKQNCRKNCETKTLAYENSRNVKEIIIPPEKWEQILKNYDNYIKWNTLKYLSY